MKDDPYGGELHAWIDPGIEARMVAMILGEASAFETDELERLMEERPELRVFKRRLEVVHSLLGEVVKGGDVDDWRLSPERRAEVIQALGVPPELVEKKDPVVLPIDENREHRVRKTGLKVALMAAACLLISLLIAPLFMTFGAKNSLGSKRVNDVMFGEGLDMAGGSSYGLEPPAGAHEMERPPSRGLALGRRAEAKERFGDSLETTSRYYRDEKQAANGPAVPQQEQGGDARAMLAALKKNMAVKGFSYSDEDESSERPEDATDRNRPGFGLGVELATELATEPVDGLVNGLVDGKRASGRSKGLTKLRAPADRPEEPTPTAGDLPIVEHLFEKTMESGPPSSAPAADPFSMAAKPKTAPPGKAPAKPSSALAKVLASSTPSSTAIPVPEVEVPDPSTDFGITDDFGSGWGGGGDAYADGFHGRSDGEISGRDDRRGRGTTGAGTMESKLRFLDVERKAGSQSGGLLPPRQGSGRTPAEDLTMGYITATERHPDDATVWSNSSDAILNNPARETASPDQDKIAPGTLSLTGLSNDGQHQTIMRGLAEKKAEKMAKGTHHTEPKALDGLLVDGREADVNGDDGDASTMLPNSGAKSRELAPRKGQVPASVMKDIAPLEKSASEEAFSTFSLHVSDVSFKLAQAALAKGEWPEAERVRVEEFVNAFDYGDPAPALDEKVACQLEQAVHPFMQQRNLLRVSMRTATVGRAAETPLRLTVLLDNSGSMERADRVASVRNAFRLLAEQLNPQDKVSLISFARTPRLLRDSVPGDKAAELINVIENTPSEGGTNLEEALRLGIEKAGERMLEGAQNRIILLTDGAANLGNAEPVELAKLVGQMRQKGIAFDACGVGAEGLNDDVLEGLTRKGDGRYYFLDRPEDADAGFAKQIAGALRPAAKNVKVQVEFNPKRVGRYRLYGFEKHELKKEDFRNDRVDAAELAAEEAGVAIYQVEALPDGQGDIGTVSVRFQDIATGEMVEKLWTIPHVARPTSLAHAAPSMQLAASAAFLGEKLKGTPVGETVKLDELSGWSRALQTVYPANERVGHLVEMIEKARDMTR